MESFYRRYLSELYGRQASCEEYMRTVYFSTPLAPSVTFAPVSIYTQKGNDALTPW